jgi:hypothetical protein
MALRESRGRSFRRRRCSRFPPHLSNEARPKRRIDNGVVPFLRASLGKRKLLDSWRRPPRRRSRNTGSRSRRSFRIFRRLVSRSCSRVSARHAGAVRRRVRRVAAKIPNTSASRFPKEAAAGVAATRQRPEGERILFWHGFASPLLYDSPRFLPGSATGCKGRGDAEPTLTFFSRADPASIGRDQAAQGALGL